MIKGFLKLFGLSDEEATKPARTFDSPGEGGIRDLENFVDYIVRALVDSPEAVKVDSEEQSGSSVIKINCKRRYRQDRRQKRQDDHGYPFTRERCCRPTSETCSSRGC